MSSSDLEKTLEDMKEAYRVKRMSLPMSLRRATSEKAYQQAKKNKTLIPLQDEVTVISFKYWKIIANRFPYDSCYDVCDMLIPKRTVPRYKDLRYREKQELRKIIHDYVDFHYDQVTENMSVNRSVDSIWHIHLLKFVADREEFKL